MAWDKFRWDHWENDASLALCSLAAQGLWMRLLCICAKNSGYLLIADEPPPLEEIAYIMRQPVETISALVDELERRKVFSRTGRGVIYSRKMVRDRQISAMGRENGLKGGNPQLRKDKRKSGPVNPSPKKGAKAESELEPETETEREKLPTGGEVRGSGGKGASPPAKPRKEAPPAKPPSPTRGTRLPVAWFATPELRAYAAEAGFSPEEIDDIEDSFRLWWPAQPGQKGVKVDWNLTWMTWVRTEKKRRDRAKGTGPSGRRFSDTESLGALHAGAMAAADKRR